MNAKQIDLLLSSGKFPNAFHQHELVETHISYVLLGRTLAYKMKKSIKYSFLDFSTLARRKYFCEREVMLNNRLSNGVYLGVVPVHQEEGRIIVGGTRGKIIDYAVKMKRLQGAKQMHLMLDQKLVTIKHMKVLSNMIRAFHQRAEVIHTAFDPAALASRFNDIRSIVLFVKHFLGSEEAAVIRKAVRMSDSFLRIHHEAFEERIAKGYIRDCHGDLHSRNIFLYARPVIFDCLEFNDDFRKIDILDELAFFCMDLEAEGFEGLSKAFTDYYFTGKNAQFGKTEHLLFTYYKCYRANVRAKVNALRAMNPEVSVRKGSLADVKKYLELMDHYLDILG